MRFPISNRSFFAWVIQNPSLHQGTCSKFQFFSSLFFSSPTETLRVLTRIDFLGYDKLAFLNASKSVRAQYLEMNDSFHTIFSVLGIMSMKKGKNTIIITLSSETLINKCYTP